MYILVEVQIWQKCCIWTFMLFYNKTVSEVDM
jgi:hypothetical protein